MNRRHFRLSAAALGLPSMRVGAAAPTGVADADLARTLSGFYDVALNEMPEQATVFGVDTGTHAALKGELHHASIAATPPAHRRSICRAPQDRP